MRWGSLALLAGAVACGGSGASGGSAGSGGVGGGGTAGSGAFGGSAGASASGGTGAGGGSAGSGASGGAAGSIASGGVGGSSGSAGFGASGGSSGSAGAAGSIDPTPWDTQGPDRDACSFGPGSYTTASVGSGVPHGDALPFQHVVVMMMENRSFDHYFSKLPSYGVTDVDVASDSDFNYDPDSFPLQKVQRFHESRYCTFDTNHEWSAVHVQWDLGAMDGFVSTNNPGGARAMGYYDQTDIPYYYWLAKTFAISDRHFSSLLGPTWPNRFYFYGASSWGNTLTGDVGVLVGTQYLTATKILDLMDQAGRSWAIYRDGSYSFAVVFNQTFAYEGSSMAAFDSDVAADALPDLSIIDPDFGGSGENDEHPPTNIQRGQQLVAHVVGTLMSNPAVWQSTVFFLLYDEHGGFYDHVDPPPACEPDNYVPPDFRFDRLGIRTPLVVVSPFVRPGYVSHRVTDITSVTRFIENRFDLPAMTRRDANVWPMLDMFDFGTMSYSVPPAGAPDATPDPAGVAWCANNPPGTGTP